MLEISGAPVCNRTEICIVNWFDSFVVNDMDCRTYGRICSIRLINCLLKVVLSICVKTL